MIERELNGKRIDDIVKTLGPEVGTEFQARRAVEKVFEDVGKLYKQNEIIYALWTHKLHLDGQREYKEALAKKEAEDAAEEAAEKAAAAKAPAAKTE